ncbi:MAG: GPW/gp25 family protein [Myxococcota bacterium]
MAGPSRSFLSRLTRRTRPSEQAPTQAPTQAVVDNLIHVFNTRKGCGSVIEPFGLGDYEAAVNTHDAVNVLLAELPALVERYEPRLQDPKVVLEGRYGYSKIRFGLRGRVQDLACDFVVDIDTTTRQVDVWLEGR